MAAIALGGCRDNGSSGGGTETDGNETESGGETGEESSDALGPVGLRRLTRYEYDNTLRDILGDSSRPGSQVLPEDPFTPFDNEYGGQEASQPLIEGLESLARDAAQDLRDDPARRDEVVGCTPVGPSDDECMGQFVARFGRRALRRSLSATEVDDYVALGLAYADRESDFYAGMEVIVRALLQDGEMVYRVETGTPVDGEPGVFALGDFEIASRLSYLLWASAPSDALLDAAEAGELRTPEQRQAMARTMLEDPRARAQVDRFHAMWLGYVQLPHSAELTNALRTETSALVEQVIFEDASAWIDLFTATETFIDATLAEHYGLPAGGSEASWVPYGDSGRRGILSHGSFLSVAAGPGDTSPTRRGKWIREQLMCQPIPPPPPDVDADNPPTEIEADCKADQYLIHAEVGACRGCHAQMDPIGFGLEQYDREGRFRTTEPDSPQCSISGDGELVGVAPFNGPAELSGLLVDNSLIQSCVAQQLYRFALGREVEFDDMPLVLEMADELTEGDGRFDTLLATLVAHPAFALRREE
ncbi:MAG: DUF1592 domain-containing protein [Deltaproteobacteria bacterium]|nr:DUF1592 domain-containing protein [Deltaproteobacteria bacterium]